MSFVPSQDRLRKLRDFSVTAAKYDKKLIRKSDEGDFTGNTGKLTLIPATPGEVPIRAVAFAN